MSINEHDRGRTVSKWLQKPRRMSRSNTYTVSYADKLLWFLWHLSFCFVKRFCNKLSQNLLWCNHPLLIAATAWFSSTIHEESYQERYITCISSYTCDKVECRDRWDDQVLQFLSRIPRAFVLLIGNGTARPTTAIYMLVIQTTSVDITVLKPIERRVANIFDSIAKRQSMRCKWERSVWRFRWWSQPVPKSKNGKEKEGKQTSSIGRLAESMMILVVESRKDQV